VQFDEKWSFVGKKEKHCDPDEPADAQQGDNWDHVALDPEHRLVLSVVPGKRTSENARQVVQDFKECTQGRIPNLITTDEYPVYETELLDAYGEVVIPAPTGKPGRPQRHGAQDSGKRSGNQDRFSGDLRHGCRGDGCFGGLDGEHGDQHRFRGTAQRHRPQPQRPESSQDLLFLEGLAGA